MSTTQPGSADPRRRLGAQARHLAALLLRSSLTYQRVGSLRCSAQDHDLTHLDTNSLGAYRRIRARQQRGQALLETAITVPLMLLLLLGFLAVLVRVEAQLELDAATSLAAAAAVNAPAASPLSAEYARQTWAGTLRQYRYLRPGDLEGCGAYQPGQPVTCRGSATLDYTETPMGLVVPLPIHISSVATARSSLYRSR